MYLSRLGTVQKLPRVSTVSLKVLSTLLLLLTKRFVGLLHVIKLITYRWHCLVGRVRLSVVETDTTTFFPLLQSYHTVRQCWCAECPNNYEFYVIYINIPQLYYTAFIAKQTLTTDTALKLRFFNYKYYPFTKLNNLTKQLIILFLHLAVNYTILLPCPSYRSVR